MGYEESKKNGDAFEDAFWEYAELEECLHGVRLGYERHEESCLSVGWFVDDETDLTYQLVRHMPDFAVVLGGETWLLDAKAGRCISRKAYDAYALMENHGLRVGIVVKHEGQFKYARISDLRFLPYEGDLPCEDGFWAEPEKAPFETKELHKRAHGNTNAFAYLDKENTPFKRVALFGES